MSWLMLTALGMMWAAFLLPIRKASHSNSVKDFERNMELLADTDRRQGRWIVTPRKGMAFVGPRAREHVRARERRRRVLVFLLESIVLSFLIGLVPPLRDMWLATGALFALLLIYLWMLVSIKQRGAQARSRERARAAGTPAETRSAPQRYAAEGRGRNARPTFNGLGAHDPEDAGDIVVRRARQVRVAGV
jgi:hypothetical protein